VFLLIFIALIVRLVTLDVLNHSFWAKSSVAQVRSTLTTKALRAGIYDRNGLTIAVSRPTALVLADNFQIKDPLKEARALSPLVHIPVEKLRAMLSTHNGYVPVTHSLNLDQGRHIASLNFPGIVVQNSSMRSYPQGTIAQSLIGGLDSQGLGNAGIELASNSTLAGQNGVSRLFLTPSGVAIPGETATVIKKAVAGTGLELTIDSSLQYVTEQNLAQAINSTHAVSGVAIVMDVKTGEILANASLVNTRVNPGVLGKIPTWQKNIGVGGVQASINNLAFTSAYEPGSVFKVVTFSAALAQGTINANTPFTVPGHIVVGTRKFHDAEAHGTLHLTATQILAQSSNIGTYLVGKTIGKNAILAAVQRFGFGLPTGLAFPGETRGLVVNAANYYASDNVALPIGQVDAVPPIQVLDAYNAIANGGVFVSPKLVRGYVYPNGSMKSTPKSAKRRVLSASVDQTMIQMLEQVVLAGTGSNAIIPGYLVAGKTGTATIPTPGKDTLLAHAYNATFVGFAPANHPVLSMIVIVQRPQTTIFGGAVAAPVFKAVMGYALRHYGIPSSGVSQKPLTGKTNISSDVT
jgi:cell division protein FtsI (penicillin-binding protein 3)